MFTIYIHILEVLADHLDGTFADNIHAWGSCYEKKDIEKGLKSLLKDGYVTKTMLGKVRIWHITDKALEYCETVVRKHDNRMREQEALAMHEARKNAPENPYVGVIPGAYEELPMNMVVSGDYVFSVDEDGTPDHAYVGLANDDGSLPFDAIVTTSENMASEGAKEGVTDAPFALSDVTYMGGIENASTDFYDACAECGRKFLARCSWDNFYCDDCYTNGAYETHEYGGEHGDEELGF